MDIEQEREDRFNAQWDHVMTGLDRAVKWIKKNKANLRNGFHLDLALNRETGIEISLGHMFEHDLERIEEIRKLFKGQEATRSKNSREENFRLKCDDLIFRWTVLMFPDDDERVVEHFLM